MIGLLKKNLGKVRQTQATQAIQQEFIDIHCHCLPGFDDGPPGIIQSLKLCRELEQDGITTVIATPHQLGRYSGCYDAANIRKAVHRLNENLKNNNITLKVKPGSDTRIDERIPELLEADKILTLADGGKYILLELPHEIFINIRPLIVQLFNLGIQAVISHPERHHSIARHPAIIFKWFSNW